MRSLREIIADRIKPKPIPFSPSRRRVLGMLGVAGVKLLATACGGAKAEEFFERNYRKIKHGDRLTLTIPDNVNQVEVTINYGSTGVTTNSLYRRKDNTVHAFKPGTDQERAVGEITELRAYRLECNQYDVDVLSQLNPDTFSYKSIGRILNGKVSFGDAITYNINSLVGLRVITTHPDSSALFEENARYKQQPDVVSPVPTFGDALALASRDYDKDGNPVFNILGFINNRTALVPDASNQDLPNLTTAAV